MALNVGDAYISMTVDRSSLSSAFAQGRKEATDFANHAESEVKGIGKSFSAIGEMAKGVFQGIGQSVAQMGLGVVKTALGGVKGAVLDLNNEAEAASAKINAFTKNSAVTAEILNKVRVEASKTPFAFQEMANAMGSLLPVAKGAGVNIDDLIKQAEILAASNPLQGLEGASFSLREAMNGDFGSIIERFDLSRVAINKWKEEGKSNMEIVSLALKQAGYDGDLVSAMGETMAGRWSTLTDTIDTFKISASRPIFDVLKNGLVTVQGYLDTNSDAINKYAGLLGGAFAKGMSIAGNYVKDFLDNFMGVNSLAEKGGTPIEKFTKKLRDGFAWVKDAAISFYDTMQTIIGGVSQLYDAIANGDVKEGPFYEDSPLMVGIFTFREYIQKAMDKYEELRGKLGIPLPNAMGKADLPGMSGAEKVGAGAAGALAIGGVAAGALALAPALSPVVSIIGTLVPMLGTVVGALGPVGLALGAVALAAGGLYLAWNNNLFGIQDTVRSVFPEVESTIAGFKDWLAGAFDNIAALTEPLRSDFLGFWKDELSPALSTVGDNVIVAFDRIRDSVIKFANSEGLQNFIVGVKNMGDAVMPVVVSVAGSIRDDLGPAVLAVAKYGATFAEEFGKAAAHVIDVMGPFFGWMGDQLTKLAGWIRDHSERITLVFRSAWDIISGIVKTSWDLVSGIVLAGLKLLQGDWSGAWDMIKQTLAKVWQDIKDVLYAATVIIAGVLDLALAGLKLAWENAWKWISDKLTEISGAISTTLTNWSNGLVTFLDTNADKLKTAIMSPFEKARDGIGSVFSAFVANIKAPLNEGLKAFNSFGGGLASVLSWIAGKLKLGVTFEFASIPELATGTGPNWSGGMAWVGDGNGGSGAELAYLAPGSHVIPHEQSMGLVKSGAVPMFGQGKGKKVAEFALGLDGIPGLNGIVDFFTKGADKVVSMALETAKVAIPNIPGVEGGGGALFEMAKNWIVDFVKGKMGAIFPQGGDVLTKALAAAESQLGKPYQWGGNGDPSFDCSGFVKYVTEAVGLATGMPRMVSDIYGWAAHGKNPMFTFGFNNPTNPDPRIQHMGVGIGTPGGGMQWFEAGGRAGGIGRTDDYWSEYGYPPGLEAALATMGGGPGGSAPFNSQAPEQVVQWLLGGLAKGGGPSSWLTGADIIAKNESNYNPNAVNNWDINAQNGNPSMGLMQVIRDHFAPEEDPFNPFDNVAAATRYIKRKYGDMYDVPGPKSVLSGGPYLPYYNGGWVREPVIGFGLHSGRGYTFGEKEAEYVTPASKLTGGPSGRTPSGGMANPIDPAGLTGGPRGTRPDGTPLGLSAAQQMNYARTTGLYIAGELAPDDPAILAMIAEYNRGKAGINNGTVNPLITPAIPRVIPPLTPTPTLTGGPRGVRPDGMPLGSGPYISGKVPSAIPQRDPLALPPPPGTTGATPPPGTAAASAGKRTLVIKVVSSETLIKGVDVTRAILSEPVAIEDLAEGVTEIQATWEKGDPVASSGVPLGGGAGPLPVVGHKTF